MMNDSINDKDNKQSNNGNINKYINYIGNKTRIT